MRIEKEKKKKPVIVHTTRVIKDLTEGVLPERYECILSVDEAIRQRLSGLVIKEVREWYTAILLSDKLWDKIKEPDKITITIVKL